MLARKPGLLAAISLVVALPAAAQEQAETPTIAAANARAAEANARAAESNARAAEVDAEAKLAKSRMDSLGLNPATGQTTLGEGAGAMESWILSSSVMKAAAERIVGEIRPSLQQGGHSKVVLLAPAQTYDPSIAVVFERRRQWVDSVMVRAARGAGCATSRSPGGPLEMVGPGALAAVGSVLGLLRTDTEIRGLDLAPEQRVLINAIASRADPGVTWLIPDEASLVATSPLLARVDGVRRLRDDLVACRALKAKNKTVVALLDPAIAKADSWEEEIVTAGTDGGALLTRAAIADATALHPVLRVAIEKAGGTLFKRSNVWTALGARAVGLTGGLIVSYRLVRPGSGEVAVAGLVACRTKVTGLRSVHAEEMMPDLSRCSAGGATITAEQPSKGRDQS